MTQHEPGGFELLTNHRLAELEATVREDHRVTAELRVALAEFKSATNARAGLVGGVVSIVVSLLATLLPLLFL